MKRLLSEALSLTWDAVHPAAPEKILQGKKQFRPFLSYQRAWSQHFYPDDLFTLHKTPWYYLQKYMMPQILRHASSYHIQGIYKLGLQAESPPDFAAFQHLFSRISNGFRIETVDREIEPQEYFSLIRAKKFPCVAALRSHHEIFCANEPDFWHEAIGHIAPLCFREVQDFYLEIAEYMLSARSSAIFKRHLAVAWTLMEYGFIREQGQTKMLGAALVGSHLANMRYRAGLINVETADRAAINDSGFFAEDAPQPRNERGQLRFFSLDNLSVGHLFKDHEY